MNKLLLFLFITLPLYLFPSSVSAEENFTVTMTSGSDLFTDSFSSIDELFDSIELDNFNNVLNSYNDSSAALATLDIRGVSASIEYIQNKTKLIFRVPSLGIEKEFSAFNSRVDNENDFEEYIKNNADGILTKMLNRMVSETALDPVAGNPNSLTSSMATADFNTASSIASNIQKKKNSSSQAASKKSNLEVGLEAGSFSVNGIQKTLLTLPVSYTHYFEDPRKQLRLSAPLSFIETNGSKSYKASFGGALSHPMNDNWSLTPALRIGFLASQDLGSAAVVYSGSVTSLYRFPYEDMSFTIGNMLGVMNTLDIELEDHEAPYDISSQVSKNGITIEKPIGYKILGKMGSMEVSLANTQFFGDKLYIESYTDLAMSIGTRKRVGDADPTENSMHFGLTYTFGQHDYKGGKLNFGYKF